jgi:uncharacterized protein
VPSKAGAAVVLLHGAGSTRSGVLDDAVVLGRAGYGVLLFDARGHGRSEGRAMDFGWHGDDDIAGAVTFLQAQPDVDDERIAAVGLSMGGEQAIGAAAGDAGIKAVVAEGATNRLAGDKAWLSEDYGVRGLVQEGVERLVDGAADLLTSARPPTTLQAAAAASTPRPVLLIAGGAGPDEATAGRYIRSGSPGTVELWEVPGAGHTAGLRTDPAGWEQRVTSSCAPLSAGRRPGWDDPHRRLRGGPRLGHTLWSRPPQLHGHGQSTASTPPPVSAGRAVPAPPGRGPFEPARVEGRPRRAGTRRRTTGSWTG